MIAGGQATGLVEEANIRMAGGSGRLRTAIFAANELFFGRASDRAGGLQEGMARTGAGGTAAMAIEISGPGMLCWLYGIL